jgi:hypothetical protein
LFVCAIHRFAFSFSPTLLLLLSTAFFILAFYTVSKKELVLFEKNGSIYQNCNFLYHFLSLLDGCTAIPTTAVIARFFLFQILSFWGNNFKRSEQTTTFPVKGTSDGRKRKIERGKKTVCDAWTQWHFLFGSFNSISNVMEWMQVAITKIASCTILLTNWTALEGLRRHRKKEVTFSALLESLLFFFSHCTMYKPKAKDDDHKRRGKKCTFLIKCHN